METIKSFTSLEQSKKLAEILPLESADMSYSFNFDSGIYEISTTSYKSWVVPKYAQPDDGFGQVIPCWSIGALLGVLPDELGDNHFLTLTKEDNEYCCCYEDVNGNSFRHTFADNPVDACYEMILKLNELNLL